jgi:5-methylcytosine-specific restriction endonuclease McrA
LAPRIITVTLEQQRDRDDPGWRERVTVVHRPPQCCFASRNQKLKWRKKEVQRLRLPSGTQKMVRCPKPAVKTIDGKTYCQYHQPARAKRKTHTKVPKYAIDPYYETIEWRVLRFDCLLRDKHTCRYCGDRAHQADHVIPRKKGGADHLTNLVAACSSCNRVAGGNKFASFEAKKAWVLDHRGIPRKEDRRPTELLDRINREGL